MKQRSSCVGLAAVIVVAVAVFGAAPVYAAPVSGDSEVQGAGGFFHSRGSDSGALNLDGSYGYYLTPGWQLGFRQALNYEFIDDATDAWVATTTPFVNYNFHFNDTVIPYLGAFAGAAWNDRDATGTIGPNAGIKFFLSDQTFLGLNYRYEWFFNSFKRVGNEADDGNHVFNIGFGYVWGGERKATR